MSPFDMSRLYFGPGPAAGRISGLMQLDRKRATPWRRKPRRLVGPAAGAPGDKLPQGCLEPLPGRPVSQGQVEAIDVEVPLSENLPPAPIELVLKHQETNCSSGSCTTSVSTGRRPCDPEVRQDVLCVLRAGMERPDRIARPEAWPISRHRL
jgi:hypothetical protein